MLFSYIKKDNTICFDNKEMTLDEFFVEFRKKIDSGNYFNCRYDAASKIFLFSTKDPYEEDNYVLLSCFMNDDGIKEQEQRFCELEKYDMVISGKVPIKLEDVYNSDNDKWLVLNGYEEAIYDEGARKIYLEKLNKRLKKPAILNWNNYIDKDFYNSFLEASAPGLAFGTGISMLVYVLVFSFLGPRLPYLLIFLGVAAIIGIPNYIAFRKHKITISGKIFSKCFLSFANFMINTAFNFSRLFKFKERRQAKKNIKQLIEWVKDYQIPDLLNDTSVDINSFDNDKRVIEIIDAIGKLDDKKRQKFMSELSLTYDIYHQDKLEAPYLNGLHIKNEVYVELGFNSYLTDLEKRIIMAKNQSTPSTTSLAMENTATEGKVRRLTNDNKIAMPM